MRLRTFTAGDMQSAMKQAREALGDDAVILACKEVQNGKRSFHVTAAIDAQEPETVKPEDVATDLRYELQQILRFHNVPDFFSAKLLQKASDRELASFFAMHAISGKGDGRSLKRLAMEKVLDSFFGFNPLPLKSHSTRIMLLGAPGIGKTLTIAKLAAKLTIDKKKLAVFTTDNKRAGGIEQLKAFTDILKCDFCAVRSPTQLEAELAELPPQTQALIDTAGCNSYDEEELAETRAYASLPHVEPVLVMQAGSDSLEAIDLVEPFVLPQVKRLLVTRTDTSRRFGGILAAAAAHGLSFCNISASSSIGDPLQPMDAAVLTTLLLTYQSNDRHNQKI